MADAAIEPPAPAILLTTERAAAAIGMSETAFRTQLAAGRIGPEPIRFGRSVRWSRAALEAWAHAGCPRRLDWRRMRSGADALADGADRR